MGRRKKVDVFALPASKQLEDMRATRRKKRRITYDCMNAVVQGSKVGCKAGQQISKGSGDGRATLIAVLRGGSSMTCKTCPYYDPDYDIT